MGRETKPLPQAHGGPAPAPSLRLPVSRPRHHPGDGVCGQLCFTETARAPATEQPLRARRRLHGQHSPGLCFSPAHLPHLRGATFAPILRSRSLQPPAPPPAAASTQSGLRAARGAEQARSLRGARRWQPPGTRGGQGARPRAGAGDWAEPRPGPVAAAGARRRGVPVRREGRACSPRCPARPQPPGPSQVPAHPAAGKHSCRPNLLHQNAAGNRRLSGWQELPCFCSAA